MITENKIYITGVIIFTFLLLLCGCEKASNKSDILFYEGMIEFDDFYKDIAIFDENIYFLSDDGIVKYNAVDKHNEVFLNVGTEGVALDATNEGIYLLEDDKISVYDYTGKITKEYYINSTDTQKVENIKANDKWIVYTAYDSSSSSFKEDKVYIINKKTEEATEITEKLNINKPILAINGIDFMNENSIGFTVKITKDYFNDNNVNIIYDLKANNVSYEKNIPGARCGNYHNGQLYYLDGPRLRRYDYDDEGHTIMRKYSEEYLGAMMKTNSQWNSANAELYITDNNIILFDKYSKSMYIDRLDYGNQPIIVAAPDNFNLYDALEESIAEFQAQYKTPIELKEFSYQDYDNKITLKLLANDADFDIFWLPNISNSTTLYNILEKKAYEPLSGYDSINKIYATFYEGMDKMFVYDDEIYCMPWSMDYYPLRINTGIFDKYEISPPSMDWTISDIWKLCDEIISKNADVKVFNNDGEIICTLLFLWGENDRGNKEALDDLIGKIQYYMQKEVLAYRQNSDEIYDAHDDEDVLFSIRWDMQIPPQDPDNYNYDFAFLYPRYSENSKTYFRLNDAILINKYSNNKNKAADYINILYTSEKNNMFSNENDIEIIKKAFKNSGAYTFVAGEVKESLNSHIADITRNEKSSSEIAADIIKKLEYILLG